MSDTTRQAVQRCALPDCAESIEQPAAGGPRRLYCTYEHKAEARRLRIIARCTAEPAQRDGPQGLTGVGDPGTAARWITDPFSLSTRVIGAS